MVSTKMAESIDFTCVDDGWYQQTRLINRLMAVDVCAKTLAKPRLLINLVIKSGLNRGFSEYQGVVQDKLHRVKYIYTHISK